MKKIAIITFNITDRAGTERAVCNLSNLLTESHKYAVSIISVHSVSGEAAYTIASEINLFHLGFFYSKNKIPRLFFFRRLIGTIRQLCYTNGIEVVLGTAPGMNMVLSFLEKDIKKIGCEHLNYKSASLSSRVMRKVIYPLLDAVVVLTESDAKHHSYLESIKVIPNSLSFMPEKQASLTIKRVLAIGRLTYQKGFDLLIDTISLIKPECDGWEVKIIGSGEDEDNLRKKIETLQLGNIVKIYPPTDAIIQEYLDASIYVLSSRFEGLPMVMIEAKSCGLPIVSFDCPEGPSEIVYHDEDGLLVENGDIKGLAKALLELMDDQEKRIEFGKNAIMNVKKYKPENIFMMWDNLLSNL